MTSHYKKSFLRAEIWMVIYAKAFNNTNVFVPNCDENEKGFFKQKLIGLVEWLTEGYNVKTISEVRHIDTIEQVASFSDVAQGIFINGKMSFGIAQIIVNTYLKFQWCLGEVSCPPHFPVTEAIQEDLSRHLIDEKYPELEIKSLNEIVDKTHYMKVINAARKVTKGSNYASSGLNIAELDLQWSRNDLHI
jgi:hypothetical protein